MCVILFLNAWAWPLDTACQRFITGPPITSINLNRSISTFACFTFAFARADLIRSIKGCAAYFGLTDNRTKAFPGVILRMLSATSRNLRVLVRIYLAVAEYSIFLRFVHCSLRHLSVSSKCSRRRKFTQTVPNHRLCHKNFMKNPTIVYRKAVSDKLRRNLTSP